jgi:hypothetical protein
VLRLNTPSQAKKSDASAARQMVATLQKDAKFRADNPRDDIGKQTQIVETFSLNTDPEM